MKEYKPLDNDQRLRLKEILEDLTQNVKVIDEIGKKYRGYYYRYLSKAKFLCNLINEHFTGIKLEITVSWLNEVNLEISVNNYLSNIEDAIINNLITKNSRFNSEIFLQRLFLLPKWKRSPLTYKKENNRNF